MLGFVESSKFEIIVMEWMKAYKDRIRTSHQAEVFSDELHRRVESAIKGMLAGGDFNGINPDEYNAQY